MSVTPLKGERTGGGRKKGGGGGGRKGGKGKGRGQGPEEDTVKPAWEPNFMTIDEITKDLTAKFPDCPEDFLLDIATNIEGSLQDSFIEEVKVCVSRMGQNTSASQRRRRHAQLQERVQGLWDMLHLFEKAIGHFEALTNVKLGRELKLCDPTNIVMFKSDAVAQLSRYLLRTLCSDLFNLTLIYLADDNGVTPPAESEFTTKERTMLIIALPTSMKKKLTTINTVLNGKDVATFFEQFEDLCTEEYCGVMLRKLDKKKERQLIFSHQQSLLENLRREWEPSMVLHLVVVILFQLNTNCAIHISGKLVPQVVAFLRNHLQNEEYIKKLSVFEQLIIQQRRLSTQKKKDIDKVCTSENDDENMRTFHVVEEGPKEGADEAGVAERTSDTAQLEQELQGLLDDLKQMVIKPKKTAE